MLIEGQPIDISAENTLAFMDEMELILNNGSGSKPLVILRRQSTIPLAHNVK